MTTYRVSKAQSLRMRIADQKAEALEVKRAKAAETKKAKADKNADVSPNGASAAVLIK